MKSERITVLGSPEFKAFLAAEAERENISVSELVRRRCERAPSEDEAALTAMAVELQKAVGTARSSLEGGLKAVRDALDELRMRHQEAA